MPGHFQSAAPATTTPTLRRVATVFAASLLIVAIAAPATVTATSRSVAHQSKAKITKVAQKKISPSTSEGARSTPAPRTAPPTPQRSM